MNTVLSSQIIEFWVAYRDESGESHSKTIAYDHSKTMQEQINAILADESVYELFAHYTKADGTKASLFRWDSQINVRKLNSHALFYMPRFWSDSQFIDEQVDPEGPDRCIAQF